MFQAEEVIAMANAAAKEICASHPSKSGPRRCIPRLDEQWQYEQYYLTENITIRDGIFTHPSVKWMHSFKE